MLDAQSPPTVPVRSGLFTDDRQPRLLGSRCPACGAHHFPRLAQCPYCSAEPTEDVELSATGRLWAFTGVTAPPPGYTGTVPYGFGVVELPEGIRIVTRLTEPDPSRLQLGQAVHLVLEEVGTDDQGRSVVTYAFTPDGPGTPEGEGRR